MGSLTPPPLVPPLLALALGVALVGCGGGTTGAPLASTVGTTATTAAPVTSTAAATGATPSATTTAPAAAPRAPARRSAAARTSPRRSPRSVSPTPVPSPAHVPSPVAPQPRTVTIAEFADLTLTQRASPAHYLQAGTVTGTYDGTMTADVRITSQGVLVSFTATLPGGTIAGHAIAVAVIDGSATPGLRGTGQITGGTGRFSGVHGSDLRVTGRAKPDGTSAHVRLTGPVTL